ncbi:hypothetical protein [Curtobacterium sp. MCBD17_019]|uniref:hypothetical protein n=1 Tax=Curtobacterium sp. MCBD17_019 TaxID=2175669 RepID=UPI0015E8C09A|nr:hypothetical protein [Curtobacterium sp. MCBD17_019]
MTLQDLDHLLVVNEETPTPRLTLDEVRAAGSASTADIAADALPAVWCAYTLAVANAL